MNILIEITAPVFLVIGAGYLMVWRRIFTDSHIHGIMIYTQGFAIPCLLFAAILNMDLARTLRPALILSFYGGSTACFICGLAAARWWFKRSWEDSITVGFAVLFSNTVLLGLPVVGRAYGGTALEATFALVALHAPYCYFVGITAMEMVRSESSGIRLTIRQTGRVMFGNALMLGILLGFIFNLLDLPVPSIAHEALDMIAASALPAALFGLGGVIVRYRPEGDLRLILFIATTSLVLHPLISWILSAFIFALETDLVRSAVITAAMAPGINAYIFSSMYKRAQRVVAASVLLATGLSVFTASIWLWLMA